MASRFEQEISRFHGVSPRRVEVFDVDEPIRVREVARGRKPGFREWWAQTPPLERFWRLWLLTVLGVICAGSTFVIVIFAAMIGRAFAS